MCAPPEVKKWHDPCFSLNERLSDPLDSELGRFISRDPIGLIGDTNVYRYAGNTPTLYIDVDGLQTHSGYVYPGPDASECTTIGFGLEGLLPAIAGGDLDVYKIRWRSRASLIPLCWERIKTHKLLVTTRGFCERSLTDIMFLPASRNLDTYKFQQRGIIGGVCMATGQPLSQIGGFDGAMIRYSTYPRNIRASRWRVLKHRPDLSALPDCKDLNFDTVLKSRLQ